MVDTGRDRSPERARQDYVKAIFQLGLSTPVRGAALARRLGVTRASVSKLVRSLQREGLVRPVSASDALELTAGGKRLAVNMLRRHRLVETFLHRMLGVPLHRLHADAERIEHAVSDDVARRLARFLNNPANDPHGDPIPDRAGRVRTPIDHPLQASAPGDIVRVSRIDDRVPSSVRVLTRAGVLPGVVARVGAASAAGDVQLLCDRRRVRLTSAVASAVRVTGESASAARRTRVKAAPARSRR
jgi:DtxR family Mn-dependent transcriptional regulator